MMAKNNEEMYYDVSLMIGFWHWECETSSKCNLVC